MSFMHVALFVWNEGVDPTLAGTEVADALRRYVAQIDGVESYHCGPDAGFTPGTSDFAVVGRFVSREAFLAYRDDPRHQAVLADLILPRLASRSVVQVEE